MPQFRTVRRVRHSAEDMLALVADVEHYPEFVPLCQSLRVLRRATTADGLQVLTAEMTVAYTLLRETFTSRVTIDAAKRTIQVEYIDGPFRNLENRWTFAPVSEHECDVQFFITYEFRSRTLGMVMGAVFDRAFRKFAEAFERRADATYAVASAAG